MSNQILTEVSAQMKKTVEHTLHEFSTIHTGKASPTMVESVMVEAYGSAVPLKSCAAITTPDARLIQIQPWDKGLTRAIEKAVQLANIGVHPVADGNLIRLPFPELSRERRQQFVKTVRRLAEEGCIAVRHARRDAIETAKQQKKNGQISQDDETRLEEDIQEATDKFTKDIDISLAHKEKELLTL